MTRRNITSLIFDGAPTYSLNQRKLKRSNYRKHYVESIALLCLTSLIPNAFSADWEHIYKATGDIKWQYLLNQTFHPEQGPDHSSGGHVIMGNEKVEISNNATITFDFIEDSSLYPIQSLIYGYTTKEDNSKIYGEVLIDGEGTLKGIANPSKSGYAIYNDDDYPSDITINKTNFDVEGFKYGILSYAGKVQFNQNPIISIKNSKYGLYTNGNSNIEFNDVGSFSVTDIYIGLSAKGNSKITFNHVNTINLVNNDYGFYSTGNSTVEITSQNLNIENIGYSLDTAENAEVTINAEKITAKSIGYLALAQANSESTINITKEAKLEGTLLSDAINADPTIVRKGTINLQLNSNKTSATTKTFSWLGDAIAANSGNINLSLGEGSYWEGRSDDFKDADSTDWKAAHEGVFSNLIPNLQSSGRVNVTLGDGAYWNVTGQSWVSKLDGNGTIDLRGSDTGGYAIHIGEITGSNTFLVNLNKDNKDQSDMIYVYDGSGAAEQHIVISNRDEVLNGMKVGDRVRFATVANASGGFVSEGMETEIAGGAAKTFGRSTQIRDAGVKNVNFKVVYEPYNSDQTTSEEDLGYNGEGFNDVKPGNDYVETIYSQGENPYNVYIQRDEDIAEVTDPDDPTQNVTDAGRTIIDHARANYANAVQLDTLNKRQGEMRFSQGHEDGLWARIRHDDIGKRSSFRLDNTMVEVGVDSRYVKETGEFHTGVAFDYMNGDTDYHHISGEGDLDRYGVWFYTTWLGNGGDYTDFIIKCSLIDNEYKIYAPTTGEKITGDYDNNVISVSLEHGKKYSNEESWFIEPQAQLQYAYVTSAEYTNSQGTDVRLDGIHSLIGRVGVRAGKDVTRDNPFTFYARGDIMHEFMGKQDIKAKDATGTMRVRYENDDTWYSAGLGMSYLHNKDKYYFLEAEKVFGGSNTSSYIVSGGVRFFFD